MNFFGAYSETSEIQIHISHIGKSADMGCIRAKGIVTRSVETGEADKYITLFTEEYGKISVYAKGIRRGRSKYAGSAQLMCCSDFVLFHYKDRYTLNSAEVIESFYELRNDIVKLTYAAHFMDLINDIVQENLPMPRLLKLLLNSLYFLAKSDRDPAVISVIFELKTLCILGYAPQVDSCIFCGQADPEIASFSFSQCGCLCGSQNCIGTDPYAFHMSRDSYTALRSIINTSMAESFKYGFSGIVLEELKWISAQYLLERLEKKYAKLDYLQLLDKW